MFTRAAKRSFSMLLLLVATTAFAMDAAAPSSGYSDRPFGTKPPAASMPENAIQLFKDKNFSGRMLQVSEVTSRPSWKSNGLEGKNENKFSSMRWNLPRGVVVGLFERDDCLGRMATIWGSGELDNLNRWRLNDKLSGWSWNYIGGVDKPVQLILDAKAPRPKYAKLTEGLTPDSIQLFKDREAKGDSTLIEHITSQPAGAFQDMPAVMGHSTSSLKWKLPDGVLVVFSEGKGGEGSQLAIWGNGLFDSVSQWELNDKITQWAWYFVGDAPKKP